MRMLCKKWVVAALALLVVWLFPAAGLQAEVVVLVQGYLAKGKDWRESDVTGVLSRSGWEDAGHLQLRDRKRLPAGAPRFYTLELTTDARIGRQVEELLIHLQRIRRGSSESLILIGHSAGGVVARMAMVRRPDLDVAALITVASPHRGTENAILGLAAGQSPLGWFSQLLGREKDLLGRSQGLYFDLAPEQPGNLLFWLNHQPHPPARYISVVRDGRLSWFGDLVVPEWSQDMNQVYALRGRARSIASDGNHGLTEEDGRILVHLLNRLRSP
jgi:pimeloyl-ACP methyl ester carboxylesterase